MFEPHNVKTFSFQCSDPQMVVHIALTSDVGLFFKTKKKKKNQNPKQNTRPAGTDINMQLTFLSLLGLLL